jgi:Tfp pilus assembly protein PilF
MFLAWSESNALTAEDAVGAANAGDWSQAAYAADLARRGDPGLPAYSLIAGLAELQEGSPATAVPLLQQAATTDDFPATWLDLASAHMDLGDAGAARADLTAALRIGDEQPAIAFGAGTVYLRLGDPAAATDAFGQAIRNAPTLALDPYFLSGEGAAYRGGALNVALASWPPDAWEYALLAGDTGEASRRANNLSGRAHDRALQIIAASDGDASARASLADAAKASPLDLQLVAWNARLARQAGDESAASRYRQWADTVLPGSGDLGQDLRVTTATKSFPGYGGIDTSVFGLYTYRRPLPIDLLARSLPHLVLQ